MTVLDIDAAPRERLPRQIPYIVGNEGCERFSFYGMRNIQFDERNRRLAKVVFDASSRHSGRFSTRRHRPGYCRPMP